MCADRMTVEECRKITLNFSRERKWNCFWYPRNYIFALVGEVGELVELFEGLEDDQLSSIQTTNPDLFQLLCEELSDCILYMNMLCTCAGVNLSKVTVNPATATGIDFECEFPVPFDDGIYFDDLVKKVSPEIQQFSLFTLVLRMIRKLSKISTVYQWLPNEQIKISTENAVKIQKEIAELFWYLLEVSRRFEIDISSSIRKKVIKNTIKYPPPA